MSPTPMSSSEGLFDARWLPGTSRVPPPSSVKGVSIQIVVRCAVTCQR